MQMGKWHQETDEMGFGKCSVPMWCNGIPAGFCDAPAFGRAPLENRRYSGYVPGLACYSHGGPRSRVFLDGNQWCAVWPDFIDFQQSPAGFGDTPEDARKALEKEHGI